MVNLPHALIACMKTPVDLKILLAIVMVASPSLANAQSDRAFTTEERVGRVGTNRTVTPVNQVLTPSGTQVELSGMRPQAIALSPNGKLLATSGKTSQLVIVDP